MVNRDLIAVNKDPRCVLDCFPVLSQREPARNIPWREEREAA